MVFSTARRWLLERRGQRGLRVRRGRPALKPKALPLRLEELETRVNPTPFTPNGLLGTLNPTSSVVFDTTAGQYQVDGGAWQTMFNTPAGAIALSPDPNQTTMLFNFSTITLSPNVTVTAYGNSALGLLATGDIFVATNLDFSGQAGGGGRQRLRRHWRGRWRWGRRRRGLFA